MSELSRVKRRKSVKPKNKRRPNYFLYFIVAIFFTMVVLGFKLADSIFEPVTKADTGLIDTEVLGQKESKGPVNVLIIGTDERDNEPSRSDTLILAALFPEDKQVKLISIPRDTRVKIPGKGYEKITHAHAYGKEELVIKTVENFLDIPVDYYIKVNFQGFKNIIDVLGGVTLNVEKRMYYPPEEIDLKPGLQKLNGHDALAYVRFRSDGQGDIGRVERQQKFLSALTDHIKSIATIPKIPSLIKEINTHVKTNMTTKDILYFASKFMSINHENIQHYMIPGRADIINGLSYWVSDTKELEKIVNDMQKKPVQ